MSLCLCLRVVLCVVVLCGVCGVTVCTFKNASVCTGTTPACVTTCGRGAGTHGDVLNLHTEVFGTDTRWRGGERRKRRGVCKP